MYTVDLFESRKNKLKRGNNRCHISPIKYSSELYAWRADILEQRALRESDGNGGQYSAPGIKLRMRGWAASTRLCLADTVMMLPWTSIVCCGPLISLVGCDLGSRSCAHE